MLIRTLEDLKGTGREVPWGNGLSRRFLLEDDARGLTITDTIVEAGSESSLCYESHAETCYCIEGEGELEVEGVIYPLRPGTLYALDQGEAHVLRATTTLRLVCVFVPALVGSERHDLISGVPSSY